MEQTVQQPDAHVSGRQYSLDIIRIVAIVGVVAIHTFSVLLSDQSRRGTASWWAASTLDIGFTWVVPVFVMISGALILTSREHERGAANFYRRRAKRIIPALIVWHLVYLVLTYFYPGTVPLTPSRILQLFVDAKVFTQLYFLWLIAGLYVVAPVIAAFFRAGSITRARMTAIVVLGWTALVFVVPGVMGLIGNPRPIFLGALTMWWPYVGYFVAGYAFNRLVLKRWQFVLAAVVAVGLMGFTIWQYATSSPHPRLDALVPVSYLGPLVMVASVCLFIVAVPLLDSIRYSARSQRILKVLSNASFGVFLVHLVIFYGIRYFFPIVNSGYSFAAIALAFLATVVISYAISIAASKVPYLRAVF